MSRLGLQLDTAGVLEALRAAPAALRWAELPTRLRGCLEDWLVRRGGTALRPVLMLAARGEGTSAVPLGLAAEALERHGAPADLARIEERWFGTSLDAGHRREWAGSAVAG